MTKVTPIVQLWKYSPGYLSSQVEKKKCALAAASHHCQKSMCADMNVNAKKIKMLGVKKNIFMTLK